MKTEIFILLQLVIAIGLINVWLLRFSKPTAYRGGSASNLKEEFATYGLPLWAFYAVGTLKLGAAVLLIVGLWLPYLIPYAAGIVSILMIGAVLMHIKVKDPILKIVPAAIMLCCSLILYIGTNGMI